MAEVIFNSGGNSTKIQCMANDKMKDIISKFNDKTEKKENDKLIYLYNGTRINKELTFNEQANELDKSRKKMNIVVIKNKNDINIKDEIISKEIICPECKENTLIDIKYFKINLHGCKNNHSIYDIFLNEYSETQMIDLNQIACDICKENNKGNTHNNEFYICNTCYKNICPECKSIHNENHIIINYDDKNYICRKHNEPFTKYCKTCLDNICKECEKRHTHANTEDLKRIKVNKDEIIKVKKELKNKIDEFKWRINIIKEIFDNLINILDTYYKLNEDVINNFNINKINYHNLKNLLNLKSNNEIIIKEITNIIKENRIFEVYKFPNDYFDFNNGEIYIGEMKKGLKEGKGILYYSKGDKYKRKKYEGYFRKDKKEGNGIFYWNDGEKCEGDWKNDKFEGKGIYHSNNGNKYKGEFKNNKRDGKGIMYYKNGDKYDGDWKNGLFEGKGIYYWSNGDRYEGDWKNDKKEGKGIKYYGDGKKEEGIWKNDEFLGN